MLFAGLASAQAPAAADTTDPGHAFVKSGFTFMRSEAKGNVARVFYRRDGKEAQGPTVHFIGFMLHWDEGAWRIGWVLDSPGPVVFAGKERTVEELAEHPRLRL